MKKSFLLIFLLILISDGFSQTLSSSSKKKRYELNGFGDTYVAEIKFNEEVFEKKCPCAISKESKKVKCKLYRGIVNRIYYLPDKTVFDSISLKKVNFFLITSDFQFLPNKSYCLSLKPGSSYRYLVVNKVLEIVDPYNYKFINNGIYLSGFTHCVKIGLFNRILLLTGLIKPEKINYENKKVRTDSFDEYIRKMQN
jgi:hypothetical protein